MASRGLGSLHVMLLAMFHITYVATPARLARLTGHLLVQVGTFDKDS
jgi:hypothetical protein